MEYKEKDKLVVATICIISQVKIKNSQKLPIDSQSTCKKLSLLEYMAVTKALPDHKVEIKDYQHQFLISLSRVLSAALGICMDNLVNICAKNIHFSKKLETSTFRGK